MAAGDELRLVERVSHVSIAEIMRVTYVDKRDAGAIGRVVDVPELAQAWRDDLELLSARNLLPVADFGT